MGTFIANTSGTLMNAIVLLLQRQGYSTVMRTTQCQALNGVSAGFCGALTTVSTFIAELYRYPIQVAFVYAIASIAFDILIFVLVNGIPVSLLH